MSRCGLDLMRLSKEVAAIQNARPAIALLYSHAATIRDKRHVEARGRVYEALNFCGIPIGFITDEQIASGLLSQYKCLIVAGAQSASHEAIEGMRRWAANGGLLVAYDSDNLVRDEYGRDIEPPAFSLALEPVGEGRMYELRDSLMNFVTKSGLGPEITVRSLDGGVARDVESRTASIEGRRLVNMVNYSRDVVKVRLPRGAWRDLITQKRLGRVIKLEPDVPVLAEASM
jgi:beta-galactosidase